MTDGHLRGSREPEDVKRATNHAVELGETLVIVVVDADSRK